MQRLVKPLFMESIEPKSEQRIRYESEIALIQRRFGTLEEIRATLGFSQRKMAELLLVDPSAWTRWTKDGSGQQAPPHVWRALSWFLELSEMKRATAPGSSVPANISAALPVKSSERAPVPFQPSASDIVSSVEFSQLPEMLEAEWHQRFEELKSKYEKDMAVTLGWKFFLLLNTAAVVYLIFSSFFS